MSDLDSRITALVAQVAAETAVEQSAVKLITGFSVTLAAAVQDALSKGATPSQLQALDDLTAAITSQTAELAAAVATATPAPAPAPAPTEPPAA